MDISIRCTSHSFKQSFYDGRNLRELTMTPAGDCCPCSSRYPSHSYAAQPGCFFPEMLPFIKSYGMQRLRCACTAAHERRPLSTGEWLFATSRCSLYKSPPPPYMPDLCGVSWVFWPLRLFATGMPNVGVWPCRNGAAPWPPSWCYIVASSVKSGFLDISEALDRDFWASRGFEKGVGAPIKASDSLKNSSPITQGTFFDKQWEE
eukprot:scaffold29537_cov13-Tisochrysis_lutea.AAC.1